ncbi:MlaE family ABC transporter permease [Planctomicrobium piriforme]|uniref:Phospholipid/cholesterol/gamma-HCH transport system permease protein n=1 Tax=Planctomicrobium piriforme TaxID=1576369 RepID=A0A1I3MUF0_9PLAN|nr:ABC transporter permease [Planctomicrobium piriforme]SFJ00410.1 phospholipid/cholesterol/gamma-HCH transport system permease protein [Planctomicrobium piriforme]
MPATSATHCSESVFHMLGRLAVNFVTLTGDLALFFTRMLAWLMRGWPRGNVLWPVFYQIGVQSVPVILVTGGFIGMVLVVQAYEQFAMMHMENQLGTVVNVTLVKELGPVLAAVMLAGRVGSSMAAQLGTMRVTEQIDALTALGANPIAYLVVPRFLACVMLIPMLTLIADGVGVLSGWWFSTQVLKVNSFYYWHYSQTFVTTYDIWTGIIKSLFFGASISVIACHRGFHSRAGAEGVGQAATEAFVYSFIVILALDFMLGFMLMELYNVLWAKTGFGA